MILLLWSSLFSSLVPSANGHGYMRSARAHNYLQWLAGTSYEDCPHCLDGSDGGRVTVVQDLQIAASGDGKWPWPPQDSNVTLPREVDHRGICGGIAGTGLYEDLGEIVPGNFYNEGDVIDVDITTATSSCVYGSGATAPMAGVEKYKDKKLPPFPTTQECQASSNGMHFSGDSSGQFDDCFPERYYLGDSRVTPKDDTLKGNNWRLQYKVKLPVGVTCDHCVIQWYYQTGNSCDPPGYRPAISNITEMNGNQPCGLSEDHYPEEFWNCASVMIAPQNTTYNQTKARLSGSTDDFLLSPCTEVEYSNGGPLGTPGSTAQPTTCLYENKDDCNGDPACKWQGHPNTGSCNDKTRRLRN